MAALIRFPGSAAVSEAAARAAVSEDAAADLEGDAAADQAEDANPDRSEGKPTCFFVNRQIGELRDSTN